MGRNTAPKLNPEISAAVTEAARSRDKRVESVQQQLGQDSAYVTFIPTVAPTLSGKLDGPSSFPSEQGGEGRAKEDDGTLESENPTRQLYTSEATCTTQEATCIGSAVEVHAVNDQMDTKSYT
ncbi:hypothetical protein B5X24_HaOG211714 [Helicoverpa armigera]|nr:hypothetical protein B5X24_HaOG211714 [Helicoverpa armigera]